MKKLYIIFANGIVGMGGGQMYVRNKILYMRNRGFDTCVYSGYYGEVIIEELKEYTNYVSSFFRTSPLVYRKKTIFNVIKPIIEKCEQYDEVIIESCIAYLSLWAELVAKEVQCKHMAHLLDERNDLMVPDKYLDFFWFKHRRKELSGINKNSLKLLFRNSLDLKDDECYYLPSFCQNVLTDKGDSVAFGKAQFTIGTIGRLDKPYVYETAKAYAELANRHKDNSFNFVFIGGADNGEEQKIRDLFSEIGNAQLYLMGYVYPIPISLLDKIDYFVSSAGSAGVSYRLDKTTISIDGTDGKAIGVLGYTTVNALNRKEEPMVEICDLLEMVIFDNYLEGKEYRKKQMFELNSELDKHIVFLNESEKTKMYFDVFLLNIDGNEKKSKFIASIIGDNNYAKRLKRKSERSK